MTKCLLPNTPGCHDLLQKMLVYLQLYLKSMQSEHKKRKPFLSEGEVCAKQTLQILAIETVIRNTDYEMNLENVLLA